MKFLIYFLVISFCLGCGLNDTPNRGNPTLDSGIVSSVEECSIKTWVENRTSRGFDYAFILNGYPKYTHLGIGGTLNFECSSDSVKIGLVLNANDRITWEDGQYILPDTLDFFVDIHKDSIDQLNLRFEVFQEENDLILKEFID